MLATDVSTTCAESQLNFQLNKIDQLALKMASAQFVETSFANNGPPQDSSSRMIIFNQGIYCLGTGCSKQSNSRARNCARYSLQVL